MRFGHWGNEFFWLTSYPTRQEPLADSVALDVELETDISFQLGDTGKFPESIQPSSITLSS
jgi:hypothetical protein